MAPALLPGLGDGSFRPFAPVARSALVVVDWAIDVGNRQVELPGTIRHAVGAAKEVAYAVHRVAVQLHGFLDRWALRSGAPGSPSDVTAWLDRLLTAGFALRRHPAIQQLAERADKSIWTMADPAWGDTLERIAADTFEIDTTAVEDARALEARHGDALSILWLRLVEAADRLGQALLAASDQAVRARPGSWTEVLERASIAGGAAAVLDRIDLTMLGLHAGGLGESSTAVNYTRVSGANVLRSRCATSASPEARDPSPRRRRTSSKPSRVGS